MPATRCLFVTAAFAPLVFGILASTTVATHAAAADLPETNMCAQPAMPVALGSAQWNGWGHGPDNTRYQPEPAIRATDVPKLALKWSFGYQGSVVAGQPTVVDGRLFVSSATGRIYSLDAKTGCVFWVFDNPSTMRTAISVGELGLVRKMFQPKKAKHQLAHVEVVKAPTAAIFGDDNGAVSALDAQKGTLLWKTVVATTAGARIVAAPVLFHDHVYVTIQTDGAAQTDTKVAALDMASGRVLWRSTLGASVVVPATIDAKHGWLYVATNSGKGTETSEVAAIDLADGKLRWAKKLNPAESTGTADFSAALVLRTLPSGKQLLIAGQRSGSVYGLDPDRAGELLWQSKVGDLAGAALAAPLTLPAGAAVTANATAASTAGMAGPGGGGIEYGLAADYRSVFVALSGLASEPQTPVGSLTALELKTGIRRWHMAAPALACSWGQQSCAHAQSQAITVMPGIVFSGSMDGHLRAYSTINGKIVWDYDTAKDFSTVNGIKASGGSLDQGGPTIVNGIVYMNSGYGFQPGQPGNVLLAFSVDGK